MMEVIYEKARYGGRQAIAAPRGRGKTEIVKGMLVFLVLAGVTRFPLAVGATRAHASKIYKDFQRKFATNDLLLEDFPEVCWPVRALEGAPQRAGKQHVDGKLTQITWTANEHLSFPYCPMPANLGDGPSAYGGVKMAYYGLDAALRGVNIDGHRPDFVLIDDPETEESARSLGQIETREKVIDQDIAGLGEQDEELALVVLTTIQNRYCLSYRLTERSVKPAWNGVRFGLVEKWPDQMEMWEEYIAKRHKDQEEGDEHARGAVQYYLDNKSSMDAGSVMLSDEYNGTTLEDGTQLVYSSLQACFNKIADTSMAAFRTEYQNDPEPEEEITTLGLSAAKVQNRTSRFGQKEIPPETEHITLGIDVGKFYSHWCKVAWEPHAVGHVIDYGVIETHGLMSGSTTQSVERALLGSLEVFAEEVKQEEGQPEIALVDSGTFTPAVYEFSRRMGRPYFPSKGWDANRFRIGKRTDQRVPFHEAYAAYQPEEGIWLYNVNTQFWKLWLQERFMVEPRDEGGNRNPGSMTLFDSSSDRKRHLSFAHHIVAEEQRMVPVFGKELKPEWFVVNRNNHWLDALALACAGAGTLGVKLVENVANPNPIPRKQQPKENTVSPYARDGRPFVSTRRR